MQQMWTNLKRNGPDHLGMWLSQCSKYGLTTTKMALITSGRGPIKTQVLVCGDSNTAVDNLAEGLLSQVRGAARPTAALPMENPYCSCKLTKGGLLSSRGLTAAVPVESPYRSCKLNTCSLLSPRASGSSEWPGRPRSRSRCR